MTQKRVHNNVKRETSRVADQSRHWTGSNALHEAHSEVRVDAFMRQTRIQTDAYGGVKR